MSPKLLIVFCLVLVAVQATPLRFGFNLPTIGIDRIVGGVDAEKFEFPHQVSLQWGSEPANHKHFCGGTIIDSQWILTAAHCILAVPSYGSFVVKAGKHEITVTESTEQVASIAATFVHEDYPGSLAPYDIGLLKLKEPLNFNKAINAIKLPKSGVKPTGNTTLSGWGSISSSGSYMPSVLQKAILPTLDFQTCLILIELIAGPSPLHPLNICTDSVNGKGSCSGDSGGPLILKNEQGVNEIVGIVSWGVKPCGITGAPSVYTDVSAFVEWIEITMKKN